MTYRILSFDGGGIRGIYTAQILSMLNQEINFLKNIDLFVGTSTGSFIALGLSYHFSPEDLVNFYYQFAKIIFSVDKHYDPLLEACPKYQTDVLKNLMQAHVFKANPTLGDLSKKVVIPAFKLYDQSLDRWRPYYFHNFDKESSAHTVIDVALASGAAPIFFPSYQGYIDGGVFANNPSMVGLCQALQHDIRLPTLQNIRMLSIGTGIQPIGVKEDIKCGSKGWLDSSKSPPYLLFSLITEGLNDIADEQCEQILKEQYHRLNTVVDTYVEIDAWEKMPYLVEIAKAVPKTHPKLWKDTIAWIKEYYL